MKRNSANKLFATITMLTAAQGAIGANCDATGVLTFIGATNDQTRSVWLSTTSAGNFGLQVVNTKDIVDEWSLGAPGAHISTSPELVFSNGGTHALLDLSGKNPCTIDVENQKTDPIILPQLPTVRPVPPIGILPPPDITGVMPELPVLRPPGVGITPEVPTLRPPGTGITPEVPVLRPPGTGITPEVPVLRPPGTGITPEVPVLRPPGTGITPEVPVLKPPGTGITPQVPVDPANPIGVLPPTGITPEVPVDPANPIGVLPPTGITPEVPVDPANPIGVLPPTGITPEVPVDPANPIGVLPPTGITPEIPIDPAHPIGTQPPTGITPEVPVTEGNLEPEGSRPEDENQRARQNVAPVRWVVCIQPETGYQVSASYSGSDVWCPEGYKGHWYEAGEIDKSGTPLTARYIGALLPRYQVNSGPWNLWSQADQIELRDRRGERAFDSSESRITLGMHRAVGQKGYLGVSVAASRYDSEGLRGFLDSEADRISVGPYFGYAINGSLTVNGSINYSYTDTDISLAGFRGGNTVDEWLLNIGIEGFYRYGDWGVLPRAYLNYSYYNTSDSFFRGELLGQTVDLNMRNKNGDISYSENSVVFLRSVDLESRGRIIPYFEIGARIAFDLQSEVDTVRGITSGGYQAYTNAAGFTRLGTRWVASETDFLDFQLSQENIDDEGLEVWTAKLLFQHAF